MEHAELTLEQRQELETLGTYADGRHDIYTSTGTWVLHNSTPLVYLCQETGATFNAHENAFGPTLVGFGRNTNYDLVL